jgi:hypothetical protein
VIGAAHQSLILQRRQWDCVLQALLVCVHVVKFPRHRRRENWSAVILAQGSSGELPGSGSRIPWNIEINTLNAGCYEARCQVPVAFFFSRNAG